MLYNKKKYFINYPETPGLPSCKIYEEFNRESDGNSLSEECHELKGRIAYYDGIGNLCNLLEKNIRVLCTEKYNDDFLKYRVEYLHYWLLDKAIKTFKITGAGGLGGVRIQFHNAWNSIINKLDNGSKCIPSFMQFYYHRFKDFDNTNDMYNYYYNYKYFDVNKSSPEDERKEYCKYLYAMRESFSKLKNSCSQSPNICSSLFKSSIDAYSPEKLHEQFKCNIYELDHRGLVDRTVQEKQEGSMSSPGAQSEDKLDSGLDISMHDTETSTSAITASLSLFGLVIIGFISFKLTPVGTWFHNRIINKGKITEHLQEEVNNELLDDYFLSENIKPKKKEYSLVYNSLQNIE
ncbi:PIR Superfamily Protein [Plasmodium ovale wallikeri]|uniref:PIR Superfamily Protein n=1 Tax=Plasmodium ovale wallikeri TaxID=864142 RepID=A0A1A9AI91_PLAOA|nr:PIR Superfamily Protein [Plasmodium ovale wallikeri]SBT56317.1 PIR Superfamily Protein [Plasmodium ovale wallikeri]